MSPSSPRTKQNDVSPAPILRVFPADDPTRENAHRSSEHVERIALEGGAGDQARQLIASSTLVLDLIEKAKRVAASNIPVLIQGESGTGKELLARLIHDASARRGKPFLAVNCATFTEALVESELFGHEKGAFTGAEQRHLGYFERAATGSLLLDEVGEMPVPLQAKLLRALEEETFERVGGEQTVCMDVRLIATTNRDLEQEVAQGQFRRDLFYRLNAMPLQMPALKERRQDIMPLVHYFLEKYGDQGRARIIAISPKAQNALLSYSWPGNIRQLRNVIHHACALANGSCIEPGDLPPLREPTATVAQANSRQTLAEIERQVILNTLRDVGGNKTAAALRLGVTARTLQNKMKKYQAASGAA